MSACNGHVAGEVIVTAVRESADVPDAARIEQAIAEAHLSAYQTMVVRTIAEGENLTAALDWIEACKEAGDGAATTD